MKTPLSFYHFSLLALALCAPQSLTASPVSSDEASAIVKGWLRLEANPLGQRLNPDVAKVDTFLGADGVVLYHVASLGDSGFVIVAGDDLVEPIVAFSAHGSYVSVSANPLCAMVTKDLPQRIRIATDLSATDTSGAFQKSKAKWAKLRGVAKSSMVKAAESFVPDVRVDPFLMTHWNQQTAAYDNSQACYNYYTPPNSVGNVNNDPCGCVATAMAQLMYYFQYPTRAVGTASFTVKVDGVTRNLKMRGGDGSGGAYNWASMPLDPQNTPMSDAECQAIGSLCYDAGVASHMMYAADSSGAYLNDAQKALTTTFMFNNAIVGTKVNSTLLASTFVSMLNPNLDAKFPVILAISSDTEAHAVVCDGYGYSGDTLYHHCNMGWAAQEDAWYALPLIDTSFISFTIVNNCIYNVYPNAKGEILSGRVVDSSGNPVPNATVTATRSATEKYNQLTDNRGVYAFASIPSSSRYTVSVTKTGYIAQSAPFSTTMSANESLKSGNVWGADFTLVTDAPQAPSFAQNAVVRLADNQISITFNGALSATYRLQESSDLKQWQMIQSITVSQNPTTVVRDMSVNNSKFYRLVTP